MLGSCEHCNEPSVCMNDELCLFPVEKLTYERSLFINVGIVLGFGAMWFRRSMPTFRRNCMFPFSGLQ
jgi:hypothetical protein